MRRAAWTLAATLLVAGIAPSQDLAPDVLLLSAVKRHVREELKRLPNISCLETIQREHQPSGGKWRPLDIIRLEVLATQDRELYASPGDRKFSEEHPINYAGSGTLSDGFFGVHLRTILVTGSVSYIYKGEEDVGGRRLARWEFRLPSMWSGQTIQLPEGSGTVGLQGSFWADPQTYDVVRLELNADDFPSTLPLVDAVWTINYARITPSDAAPVLLPQSAEFRMTRFTGEASHNHIEFTHCRVFGAQSAIRFEAVDSAGHTPAFGVASVDDTLRPLPGGLLVAVNLSSPITGDLSVGGLVDGVIAADVLQRGKVLIAAGSPVRGRIRRLERYTDPIAHFVVALEFTEVESMGIRHRFYADLVSMGSGAGVEQELSTPTTSELRNRTVVTTKSTLTLPPLAGVATFFAKGAKLYLPVGFRTNWRTRVP